MAASEVEEVAVQGADSELLEVEVQLTDAELADAEAVAVKLDAIIASGPGDAQYQAGLEISEAIGVITDALDRFAFSELALSFNGGKDCTVVLHLLRAVLARRFASDPSKSVASLKLVYFCKDDEFPEMHAFVDEMKAKYRITLSTYPSSYLEGLRLLETEGTKAVFMGQRRGDPHSADLEHFTPCSEGWPDIVRINPILMWSYDTIWAFLRGCGLPYCKLYDEGYTSLGSVKSTKRNPLLVQANEDGSTVFKAAHQLEDGDEFERVSRECEQHTQQQDQQQDQQPPPREPK